MENVRKLFDAIPDTVIITDTYGYVLDFNRSFPLDGLKKGRKLTLFIPDCFGGGEGEFLSGDRVFRRYTAKINNGRNDTGYTVRLSDATEEARLTSQRRKRSAELAELAAELSESNAKLSEFVMRVKELSDYSEQLRLAKVIHDDYGHAITELHTICLMCMNLKDTDPERCARLLEEAKSICRRAEKERDKRKFDSLSGMLSDFAQKSAFPVETEIVGEEPPFIKDKYETIASVCGEAYHNTLSHSMADKFIIKALMDENTVKLILTDNGKFHGAFEKGFGLKTMEENVRASGGTVRFETENGKGFCTAVEWRNNGNGT